MHWLGRGLIGSLIFCCSGAGCFPERPSSDAELPAVESSPADDRSAPTISPTPLIPIVEVSAPEPEPPAFVGRETVRVEELLAALAQEVPGVAASEAVAADYAAFLERFELRDDPELYLDYVRVKIAFEATRAGGLWGLRWAITNEQPNSEKIWAAWRALGPTLEHPGPVPELASELPAPPLITATAECDELSALFAFVARRIGLSSASEVGLFWPTGNHVVAVWTIRRDVDESDETGKPGKPVRVVVPTSQIFLDDEQSLGTEGFNPWRQKTIFNYRRQDTRAELELPAVLASAFVQAVREYGGRSQAELQAARNDKEERQAWAAAKDYSGR
ncbi:MAG: hypothetical protein R6X02_33640 [Enhygromyxa sp.]